MLFLRTCAIGIFLGSLLGAAFYGASKIFFPPPPLPAIPWEEIQDWQNKKRARSAIREMDRPSPSPKELGKMYEKESNFLRIFFQKYHQLTEKKNSQKMMLFLQDSLQKAPTSVSRFQVLRIMEDFALLSKDWPEIPEKKDSSPTQEEEKKSSPEKKPSLSPFSRGFQKTE